MTIKEMREAESSTIGDLLKEIEDLRNYKGLIGLVENKELVINNSNGDRLIITNIRTSNDGLFKRYGNDNTRFF